MFKYLPRLLKPYKPKISIVVIMYDMAREAPRTLQSLATDYQHNISSKDYEIIVVDNGSPNPLGEKTVHKYGPNFHYHLIENASPSPSPAINKGVELANGEIIGIMIDGARVVTPGLLHHTLLAFRLYDDPVIATLGWHLGPEPQQQSVQKGYTKDIEDKLFESINWPENGYRLFEISSLALSSANGCFSPIAESNAIFMRKDTFNKLGGYNEAFNLPGGGLTNLDFFKKATEYSNSPIVVLLGEGNFHQLHGGTSTNVTMEEMNKCVQEWLEQYSKIYGKAWAHPNYRMVYLGQIPPEALQHIAWSAHQKIKTNSASTQK